MSLATVRVLLPFRRRARTSGGQRMTTPLLGLITAVSLALIACAPQAVEENGAGRAFADLTAQPATVRAGGTVDLTLTNRSEHALGYNLCPASLERRVGDDWQQHPESPAEVCTMELRVLQPGASGTYQHTLPPTLPAGTYRFWAGVEWPLGEDRVGIRSTTFVVTADE
jgi:hypothetical protein